jgi:hypothetical protein
MRIAGCGHGHYDAGHCGVPGCDNDFRNCPECNPPARIKERQRRPGVMYPDGSHEVLTEDEEPS